MTPPPHSTSSPATLDNPLPPHGTPPMRQDSPLPSHSMPAHQDDPLPPHSTPAHQDDPLPPHSTPAHQDDLLPSSHPLPPHRAGSPFLDSTSQSSRDCVTPDAGVNNSVETPRTLTSQSLVGTDRSSTPLGTGLVHQVNMETSLHKRVSFQDLHHSHQEERPSSKPRPLPPIGSVYHDDPLPRRARRLPLLAPPDSISLYSFSSSSHSQLFRLASTHSLPLPDARYSRTSRELEGIHRVSPGLNSSSKVDRKGAGME